MPEVGVPGHVMPRYMGTVPERTVTEGYCRTSVFTICKAVNAVPEQLQLPKRATLGRQSTTIGVRRDGILRG